jgi:hypothetical protein
LQKESRSVSRIFLSGVLAIALLFVGSVAVVWWSTEGDEAPVASSPSGRPATPERVAAAAPTAPLAAPSALPAALAADGSGGGPGREPVALPPRPEASPRATKGVLSPQRGTPGVSRQASMPASRRRALFAFRHAMKTQLPALREQLARCAPDLSETAFVLTMEGVEAGARIADARVEERGSASEAEAACAASALRGRVIPSSTGVPASRWEMSFSPGLDE